MSDRPHQDLRHLLEKYDISWEAFTKRGRPPKGVLEKRSAIVTELHERGTPWADMIQITGLSNGSIPRLTQATWNDASRWNRQESAARQGRARKGEVKPWLTEQMKAAWREGRFDFHKRRVRSQEERQKIRDYWTPERRKARSAAKKKHWQMPGYREWLLAFHRSPEERARRSREQPLRMADGLIKWIRGRGCWLEVKKCSRARIWVRSSYEKATVGLLETDPEVLSYEYEPLFVLENGRWIKPDFLIQRKDGTLLVDVKASWVLGMPQDYLSLRRLDVARKIAADRGWSFAIWTEKGVLADALHNAA